MRANRSIAAGLLLTVLAFAAITGVAHAENAGSMSERFAAEHAGDEPVGNVPGPGNKVSTDTVHYATVDDQQIRGYLARPNNTDGPMPALIVIHEWWGLNDNIRTMTQRLASEGYTTLAVDLYEGETAESSDGARSLMEQAMTNPERLEDNLRQAFLYLDLMPNSNRIGSIGWCFGGGWSLRTALMLPEELDAAVIYYGHLVTDAEQLEPLSMPIQGHFGSEDSSIPPAEVRRFEQALNQADKRNEIYLYAGAGHAFANPSGTRYEPQAAQRSWQRTLDFLDRNLTDH